MENSVLLSPVLKWDFQHIKVKKMDEGLLKISNEINSRYKEFRFFTAVYNQGDIVYFMVFQKFLKQNQTLKYEKFVSY